MQSAPKVAPIVSHAKQSTIWQLNFRASPTRASSSISSALSLLAKLSILARNASSPWAFASFNNPFIDVEWTRSASNNPTSLDSPFVALGDEEKCEKVVRTVQVGSVWEDMRITNITGCRRVNHCFADYCNDGDILDAFAKPSSMMSPHHSSIALLSLGLFQLE